MSLDGSPVPLEVLIVEDDDTIGRHLKLGLHGPGYQTTWCRTGAGALAQLRQATCHIMILDLGLPDLDGVDVTRQARAEHPDLLIVILTARTDEIDVIAALDAGADDYLTKPFTITVLLARLRAHLRRRPAEQQDRPPVQLGDLTVDPTGRRCLIAGTEVFLRPKEFDLLLTLASRPNIALSRETLMAEVWDEHWHGSTKTLDVTMAALRTALAAPSGTRPARLPTITTLRGHGYRLDAGGT